ncbi:hypothetical protein [Leptothoe sp. PORK10 BA2]|uniref:hypothetical protein n=1 Tax=Leptothoe sp. PORK10 BA2 TaxID=3110254 RepID=UPI002B1EB4A9|nr:hypothetical protein [Leptothoe sp. PORK10 BA2]MEA5465547.1 hypothetical protein [Leptothoe sp. PORK10 BA2]
MANLSLRSRCPKFIKSALVLLSATLLSSLAPLTAVADSVASSTPLLDGIYLYGQQAVAAQPGSVYMVFEVTGNRAVGGFYMPSSSFDCFSGNISATGLDLMVVDSYEQTSHPYSLPADSTFTAGPAAEFNIEGFTPISTLSDVDQNVLKTCQTVQADMI